MQYERSSQSNLINLSLKITLVACRTEKYIQDWSPGLQNITDWPTSVSEFYATQPKTFIFNKVCQSVAKYT